MTNHPREIRRKLRILEHAEASGDVSKTCRYFGVGRASFYRWRLALRVKGEAGLANKLSVPHNHPNKTPTEGAEKVLHLSREYHLVIRRNRPWRSLEAVEFATLEWVDWYSNRRLLEPIGDIPPAEAEKRHYAELETRAVAA
jgi:hypothetical protein